MLRSQIFVTAPSPLAPRVWPASHASHEQPVRGAALLTENHIPVPVWPTPVTPSEVSVVPTLPQGIPAPPVNRTLSTSTDGQSQSEGRSRSTSLSSPFDSLHLHKSDGLSIHEESHDDVSMQNALVRSVAPLLQCIAHNLNSRRVQYQRPRLRILL